MGLFGKLRNTVLMMTGHGVEFPKTTWEKEYQGGHWDYLHGLDQWPRYGVIASYVRRLGTTCSILDVGCGEGILAELVQPEGRGRYVGIDLSEAAIKAAQAKADPRNTFLTADAATWESDESFDVIIFNEALYYFYNPAEILRRYERALTPDGAFIVSIYTRGGSMRRIWRAVDSRFECLHQTRLSTGRGRSWTIKLMGRPGVRPASLGESASHNGPSAIRNADPVIGT